MRLTVQRLMVVVLFAGPCLAVGRVYPGFGCFCAGLACLTLIRTFGWVDRLRAEGQPPSPLRTAGRFARSVAVAITLLTVAVIPVLLIAPILAMNGDFGPGTICGIVVATSLGLPITTRLRRKLW